MSSPAVHVRTGDSSFTEAATAVAATYRNPDAAQWWTYNCVEKCETDTLKARDSRDGNSVDTSSRGRESSTNKAQLTFGATFVVIGVLLLPLVYCWWYFRPLGPYSVPDWVIDAGGAMPALKLAVVCREHQYCWWGFPVWFSPLILDI